ncbi:MAG TPA: hypothetical protein VL137_11235 [Polyangiaceae bacterium]|nr:hypothetical protein [Polyangiaceae bacterium]
MTALCCACGGNNTGAKSADDAPTDEAAAPASESPSKPAANEAAADAPADKAASEDSSAKASEEYSVSKHDGEAKDSAEQKPEPAFTEGMSVSEAINAVPKGTEYLSLDPETLGRPLADLSLYKPCNLTPAQHFKLRVAVWDGKAVGIDVTSANKKLAECVRQQVSQVQWHDKVKSINTVDYSY